MDFFKSLLIIILSGILFSMIPQIAFNLKSTYSKGKSKSSQKSYFLK